jgi:predicted DNA-binding transcriptional regulator YafY
LESIKRYRLVTQLWRLLTAKHQPPLTLDRIRDELDCCSVSTAKRVIRDLRELGHPVAFDRERGGYYYDHDQAGKYASDLPGLFFTESELRSLLTMRRLLADIEPVLFGKALVPLGRKVEELLRSSGYDAGEVARRIRVTGVAHRRVDGIVFRVAADAVLTRKRLSFSYKSRSRPDEEERRRIVSPQRLIHYRDNWYLDAWCHGNDALRTFALDQMRDARLTDEKAREIGDEELDRVLKSAYGIFAGEPTAVAVLRFSPERAQWVAKEEWHPEQKGRYLEDGSYELSVPYSNPAELIMDVLKHGAHAEVLGPDELREQVSAVLADASATYDGRSRAVPSGLKHRA